MPDLEDADGLMLMGHHAKAGTHGAFLPHTWQLDWEDFRINGVSVGEIGIEACYAVTCRTLQVVFAIVHVVNASDRQSFAVYADAHMTVTEYSDPVTFESPGDGICPHTMIVVAQHRESPEV